MTDSLQQALTTLMVNLSPEWHSTETKEARQARMEINARVEIEQAEAATDWKWPIEAKVAFIYVQGKWESWYKLSVHSGKERGKAQERCEFQIHSQAYAIPSPKHRLEPFDSIEGTSYEATTACVKTAIQIDLWHMERCSPQQSLVSISTARNPNSEVQVAWLYTAIHNGKTCMYRDAGGIARARDFAFYWYQLNKMTSKPRLTSIVGPRW